MTMIYLIGGTGNQLFQYARSEVNDKFSDFFIRPKIRKLFNHTDHVQILTIPNSNVFLQVLCLPILFFDLLLVKVFNFSIFSEFDLRSVKASPRLLKVTSMGYYQEVVGTRDVACLIGIDKSSIYTEHSITMHIRGGDFLGEGNLGGQLSHKYYEEALSLVENIECVSVFTNDVKYAREMCSKITLDTEFVFLDGDLTEMITSCVLSDVFISSNSTLAYWICRLRGKNKDTITPKPFTYARNLPLQENFKTVDFDKNIQVRI